MDFVAVVDQVITLLRQRGRVAYRTLKVQFHLDDDALAALKDELFYAHQVARDEDDRILVWTGAAQTPPASLSGAPALLLQTPLPSAASAMPEAERRQLTVLFCDLVDSTHLARRFDPEDWREMVRAYQDVCATVIQRFDGYIAQYLGDGLLVYFGFPQAHEDDARRAVHTGLAMLEAMRQLNTRLEQERCVQLAVRVGIHTGLVVVGEMGGGGRHERLALGDTPNLAARLQGLAEPDTVVVSADTLRLVEGYVLCQDLGPQFFKGVDTPVSVYRVLGEGTAQSRLEVTAPHGWTPLVGRDAEVALLRERWEQVTEGLGQVILLQGEAGIGKSRLVQALTEHVAETPHIALECRGSPYHQHSALYPVIDLLQRAWQLAPREAPAEHVRKLETALAQSRLPVAQTVALFAALLSLPLPPDRYASLSLTPQQQKQKTLEALLALLLELAAQQPVLLIVEDLHWVDPSTLEWLSLLLDQVPTTHLGLLLTARPDFAVPWSARAYLAQLTLGHFARPQVRQMVEGVTGGKRLPAEVVQQIVAKADGVPLFVEELTKAVLEAGGLQEQEDHYVLTGPLSPLAIPATLQDALMARLDRLAEGKAVAQLGAVLGRTFASELLRAVAPLDELALWRGLGQLVQAEVLYQRGVPPQATYTFKHALLQDAAYQSLLRSTRQQYHQRTAQVLETQFAALVATVPELLAHHALQGEQWDTAVAYFRQAGAQAFARAANQEAVACFEHGLEALQHVPASRDARVQAVDLRLDLRGPLWQLGEFARMCEHLREAETLAQALDDHPRLGRVYASMSRSFSILGDHPHAINLAHRSLTIAGATADVPLEVTAQFRLAQAYLVMGEYRRAGDCARRNVDALTGALLYERVAGTTVSSVASRSALVLSLAERGIFPEGITYGQEAVRIAESVGHRVTLLHAYDCLGRLYVLKGDLQQAIPVLQRGLLLSQAGDVPIWTPNFATSLSVAYARTGQLAEALTLLHQVTERSTTREATVAPVFWEARLSETSLLAGHVEEACALCTRALARSRAQKEQGEEASLLHLLGDITARRTPAAHVQALAHYQQALVLAEALGMRPLQAHCHRALGMLYHHLEQHAQARTALATALELYRAMDMAWWLPQTEATLVQTAGTP